uniref:Uncharacterized protein n=1 Tax=Cyanophora sudae TaxID=1522369 RepID=A0A2Z4HG12_9EUKA|nr:hypothetical protein [Cyanophora sudae]AWW13678.1 hypothetical protein [Cyanophora sudae]
MKDNNNDSNVDKDLNSVFEKLLDPKIIAEVHEDIINEMRLWKKISGNIPLAEFVVNNTENVVKVLSVDDSFAVRLSSNNLNKKDLLTFKENERMFWVSNLPFLFDIYKSVDIVKLFLKDTNHVKEILKKFTNDPNLLFYYQYLFSFYLSNTILVRNKL